MIKVFNPDFFLNLEFWPWEFWSASYQQQYLRHFTSGMKNTFFRSSSIFFWILCNLYHFKKLSLEKLPYIDFKLNLSDWKCQSQPKLKPFLISLLSFFIRTKNISESSFYAHLTKSSKVQSKTKCGIQCSHWQYIHGSFCNAFR